MRNPDSIPSFPVADKNMSYPAALAAGVYILGGRKYEPRHVSRTIGCGAAAPNYHNRSNAELWLLKQGVRVGLLAPPQSQSVREFNLRRQRRPLYEPYRRSGQFVEFHTEVDLSAIRHATLRGTLLLAVSDDNIAHVIFNRRNKITSHAVAAPQAFEVLDTRHLNEVIPDVSRRLSHLILSR